MHPQWHDDDTFWLTHAPHMFDQRRIDASAAEVRQVLTLTDRSPSCNVLDMPCGIGRHSLEFARLGARVTGVDRTAAFVEKARAAAQKEGLDVEFVVGDMRTFRRASSFDLLLNLFTSLGYFEDHEDNLAVLRNFHSCLRPGGRLIVELAGREIIARDFRTRDWSERDGQLLLEERHVHDGFARITNRWIVINGEKRVEHSLTHWLYGVSDLHRMLEQAGFDEVRMFGSLEGTPYDNNAKRLVAVAGKR